MDTSESPVGYTDSGGGTEAYEPSTLGTTSDQIASGDDQLRDRRHIGTLRVSPRRLA